MIKEYQLPGYGLPALAAFPEPWFEKGSGYLMYECKLKKDGNLDWFIYYRKEGGGLKADIYDSLEQAVSSAKKLTDSLIKNIENLDTPDVLKMSLRLKVEKSVTVRKRLLLEEHLMLSEAIFRNNKIVSEVLLVPDNSESLRVELAQALKEASYVQLVRLNKYGVTLIKNNEKWIYAKHTKKTAIYCYRERIARGFGFSGTDHWGKTKAAIRSLLLPRANKLLQLASVRRILDDAMFRGVKVLVLGSFVFWFESKNQIGWCIKEISESSSSDAGKTVWLEGKILSKNHGRIVVLPYIKENGSFVQGHTKNSPHDGKAIPRHKNEFVELPFEMLEDDLMIGLFGELKYE